jgi:hypothetical protein
MNLITSSPRPRNLGLMRKRLTIAILLALTYAGPYVYTYWRAQSSVFPRAVEIDNTAIDNLKVFVDNVITFRAITTYASASIAEDFSWTVSEYNTRFGIFNRIFLNYRNVQVLLDLSKVTFLAQGVFNGTAIFQCSSYIDRLIIPTGAEFLPIYKSILSANNNTATTSQCAGPGPPTFDFAKKSTPYQGVLPITLVWSISATVAGEMIATQRTWQGVAQATIT